MNNNNKIASYDEWMKIPISSWQLYYIKSKLECNVAPFHNPESPLQFGQPTENIWMLDSVASLPRLLVT